jgi:glycosyltransferase involved in cell wall biosynthesis
MIWVGNNTNGDSIRRFLSKSSIFKYKNSYKKNNYKDLYTKMLYCINNQNIIKQISINSRDYVTKYHQWYKITDEIYKLYIKLIKNVITG